MGPRKHSTRIKSNVTKPIEDLEKESMMLASESKYNLCRSVKSKQNPFAQCSRCVNSALSQHYCTVHSKQKNPQDFDINLLNPLNCHNQCDPVTLENIWVDVDGKRQYGDIPKKRIFCYISESPSLKTSDGNPQKFQRGLEIDSMAMLLKYEEPKDPFTNTPLSKDVIIKARQHIDEMGLKPIKHTDDDMIRGLLDDIIESWAVYGYAINRDILETMTKPQVLKWLVEIEYMAKQNRIAIPLNARQITKMCQAKGKQMQIKSFTAIRDVCGYAPIASLTTLYALCWVNSAVANMFPDLQ